MQVKPQSAYFLNSMVKILAHILRWEKVFMSAWLV